jgi:orotate phosphoribosyltransferase-like protein
MEMAASNQLVAGHLNGVFDTVKRERIIMEVTKVLRRKSWHDVDFFVGRGVSGIAVASMLAYRFDKQFCAVRKAGDGTHSWYPDVEGFGWRENADKERVCSYAVVDDLIASGDTMRAIHDAMTKISIRQNVTLDCRGVILYASEWTTKSVKEACPWAKHVHIFDVR